MNNNEDEWVDDVEMIQKSLSGDHDKIDKRWNYTGLKYRKYDDKDSKVTHKKVFFVAAIRKVFNHGNYGFITKLPDKEQYVTLFVPDEKIKIICDVLEISADMCLDLMSLTYWLNVPVVYNETICGYIVGEDYMFRLDSGECKQLKQKDVKLLWDTDDEHTYEEELNKNMEIVPIEGLEPITYNKILYNLHDAAEDCTTIYVDFYLKYRYPVYNSHIPAELYNTNDFPLTCGTLVYVQDKSVKISTSSKRKAKRMRNSADKADQPPNKKFKSNN